MLVIYVDSENGVFNLAQTTERGRELFLDPAHVDEGYWGDWSEDQSLDELFEMIREAVGG